MIMPLLLFITITFLSAGIASNQDAHEGFFSLHPDVSNGNLFLLKSLFDEGTTFGRLIDYDHAKQASSTKLVGEQKEPPSNDDFTIMQLLLRRRLASQHCLTVNMDVLTEAYSWVEEPSTAANYISAVVVHLPDIAPKSTVDITKLAWTIPDPHRKWPDWQARRARSRLERTGTLEYMSAEVILGDYIIQPENMPLFAPEAIHDFESLLWVLVRICLTRKGPGIDAYRDELIKESEKYNRDIAATVKKYCQTENTFVLKDAKADLMNNSPEELENIIECFHPYFDPLKNLVRRWWGILIIGYKYRAYEFFHIHGCIFRLLSKLSRILQSWTTMRRVKADRRNHELAFLPKQSPTSSHTARLDSGTLLEENDNKL